jgi:hypothetical protein
MLSPLLAYLSQNERMLTAVRLKVVGFYLKLGFLSNKGLCTKKVKQGSTNGLY